MSSMFFIVGECMWCLCYLCVKMSFGFMEDCGRWSCIENVVSVGSGFEISVI